VEQGAGRARRRAARAGDHVLPGDVATGRAAACRGSGGALERGGAVLHEWSRDPEVAQPCRQPGVHDLGQAGGDRPGAGGEATRVTDTETLERLAGRYRDGGWPAEVDGDAFTAPFSAPSAGPPPWQLYRFALHTAFGVATAKPYGATRWRFR
jgi:hypothetical protein